MSEGHGRSDPVLQAIDDAAQDSESTIRKIEVLLNKKAASAYYLSDSKTVKFRHEGKNDKVPPFLCLQNLARHKKRILVYYSSSGSGKTSELVGSSASRGAHLAIVISVEDPSAADYKHFEAAAEVNPAITKELSSPSSQQLRMDQATQEEMMKKRSVNRRAMGWQILKQLDPLMKKEKKHLRVAIKAAKDAKQPLKLVLAIDEASSCPRVIRGILRGPGHIKDLVSESIENCIYPNDFAWKVGFELDVEVSVCGTGVASSTIGSLPDNFCTMTPYHETEFELVIAESLRRKPITLSVPWSNKFEVFENMKIFEQHLPVLAMLMQNGRVASIALRTLREHSQKNPYEDIHEGDLVNKIIERFMDSNGLFPLTANEECKRVVAACALAVHLFSQRDEFKVKVPESSEEVANWAAKMDFFPFSTNEANVSDLVKTYGLLEPSKKIGRNIRGQHINPPLKMSIPQQLIAVFMLGLDLDSMLDPTWFGFELMSTHFVKCALAASAAVKIEKRPSVRSTLERLGFRLDKDATKQSTKDVWDGLEGWNATFASARTRSEYHSKTRQLNVGLDILCRSDESSNENFLQVDTKLLTAILDNIKGDKNRGSIPPIACVNEGNSDLCDGIVTFFAIDKRDGASIKKISIMIQAKDYHDTSKVDAREMNLHAKKHDNKVLDGLFGETRLFCVASTADAMIAQRSVKIERDYFPFVFSEGELLSDLLGSLQSMRSRKFRIAKYASFCDENGDLVPYQHLSTRKRKATSQNA